MRSYAGDLGSEGIRISFEYRSYGFLPNGFVFHVIIAAIAIAIFAILSAGEALAIELQTPAIFAVAILFPRCNALYIHLRSTESRSSVHIW